MAALGIIWHAATHVLSAVVGFVSSWSMEILLCASFGMQLLLSLFAGCRWRGASGLGRSFIWLSYVGGDFVAKVALGHLSVAGTSGDRHLVAFWAPFFLLHLGGSDSISAYELEDNQLSARAIIGLVLQAVGAFYVVYKSVSGSLELAIAVWLMLAVGFAKYAEKTLALYRANWGNLRRSVEVQRRRSRERRKRRTPRTHSRWGWARWGREWGSSSDDDDDDLKMVMKAHQLFHICKEAMVDSSSSVEMMKDPDDPDGEEAHTKDTLFQLDWKGLCTVMEMELSLMYDFLYTKTAVIHTWHGYCIRALSPAIIVTASVLVEVELNRNHGLNGARPSDVAITRALLMATFFLETVSLLRALGSSWAGFSLLAAVYRWSCSRHAQRITRWWYRLHRVVAFASVGRLANYCAVKLRRRRRPYSHSHRRSWSGKAGQLNMLQVVIRRPPADELLWGSDDGSSQTIVVPPHIKELVFRRVRGKLVALRNKMKGEVDEKKRLPPPGAGQEELSDLLKIVQQLRTTRGEQALRQQQQLLDIDSLGDELHVGILIWHIATEVYLADPSVVAFVGADREPQADAIRMLSNYLMFLLVVRPEMLPGLVTRRLFEATCDDLANIWALSSSPSSSSSSFSFFYNSVLLRKLLQLCRKCCSACCRPSQRLLNQHGVQLARLLKNHDTPFKLRPTYKARQVAMLLLGKNDVNNSLRLIFEVWVEMLFYASYRCSRESHAKWLSHGGELTTIVWLMAEHVGLFVIDKTGRGATTHPWKGS